MKFTLSWLKQHLDTTAPLAAICEKLTAIGLEVESLHDRGAALKPFIIAEVIEAKLHPNADRLKVCRVNTGAGEIQVICGAPNCRTGLKTVLARPGDVIPETGKPLEKGLIRGLESQGMLCAADELGLGDEHEGIIELAADAPVGKSFSAYAGYDDPVIEINLTPNRPDCAGVRGIARDLAASGLGTLKPLEIKPVPGKGKSPVAVMLDFPADAKNACPMIVARHIRNIQNRPSPQWLQDRLTAIGQRPISAVVDITNLMTYDVNRPLHAFDAAKIKGGLRMHLARGGESQQLLNGKSYVMQPGMVLGSDETGPLELAGIMGGQSTACASETTEILIIAAMFDPIRTAKTGRALQITSDARYRFERGIDPEFLIPGAELATQLVLDLCATPETVVSEIQIVGSIPPSDKTITLDPQKCLRYTGLDVAPAEQKDILQRLGFTVEAGKDKMQVKPPSWRPDIEGEADLVEEIIRIKGYEQIPATSLQRPEAVTQGAIDAQDMRAHAARRALAAQGLMESISWSFMSSDLAAQFGPINDNLRLKNPISSDLDVMRPTVLANLIQAAKRNADRGFADVHLFEVGPVFKDETPTGQEIIATAIRAGATPRHWASPSRPVDVFDAKADALAALAAAGAPVASLQVTADAPAWYHPGRSGALRLGPMVLGYFGEMHPAILEACDAAGPMTASEIFFARIPASRATTAAKPLLKLDALQPVIRDFAFLADRDVTAAKLVKSIRDAEKTLIRDVTVFDIYEGKGVPEGKKSVALSVTLQPTDKTLTDADLEAFATRVAAAVAKATGATLRG
jgi:phenylalanyl-tRNA synthetase beta chain